MLSRRAPRPVEGVLAGLARGVLGPGYEPEVPARMLDYLSSVPSAADRKQVLTILRALDTKLGAAVLTGKRVPVSWLSSAEAELLVQKWKSSRFAPQRRLAGLVIALSLLSLYQHSDEEHARIGYPGPLGPAPREPKRLQVVEISEDETIACDVVVVGSGAGGGCVAGRLAAEGFDVVVLEKGGYNSESDFTHLERDARNLYLYGQLLTTSDAGCQIIAGSTLGGGTVVNYTTSFRTPQYVLEEWARVSGVHAFVSGEFEESLDQVSKRLGVNMDSSAAGKRDELMEEGLKKLGWHVDSMPRNVRGCTQDENCGYCGFGCRVGAKQSSMRTYLEDAAQHGAMLMVGADVRRVRIDGGRATGVDALAGGHRLTVNARAVVVGCGSIETPALLLRSGLTGQVGRNLRLHPGTAAWGIFDDDVRIWEGTTQARYSNELAGADGGYGPLLETVPVHPGSGAAAVPWLSALDHRARMADFRKLSFVAVLPRDRTGGRVTIAKDGTPRAEYKLVADDQRRISEGVIAAGKVLEAAGARSIYTMHPQPVTYEPGTARSHDRWAEEVARAGFENGRLTYFSYHQMGSCRMGADPGTCAVGPDNESHEVANLFVTDASTFPTASGVNPMLTIYGIANRAANKIGAKLS
jgi:choline dehydrogenase-like flavoprotein